MRTTQFMLATLKETPTEAEIISHQLMLRAGMIRRLASGIYTWLPLGLRVLRRVETIIREEMNRAGAQEVLLPAVQPAELWNETNRWDTFGPLLLKITDSNDREYCFGPTHEEVITDLARKYFNSYKQVPTTFYQIQTKFRDEIRPRFGVMRAREFLMKDAYSFDLDKAGLEKSYEIMYGAYCKIFDRIGLNYRPVYADTGSIGGSLSQEFHVLADTGEDIIFYSDESNYAANVELAEAIEVVDTNTGIDAKKSVVNTGNKHSIEEVSKFLQVSPSQIVKTLLVKANDESIVALLIRGDHELNPLKLEKHPKIAEPLTFATEEEVFNVVKCPPGNIGPIGLKIPIIADRSVAAMHEFICGANKQGKHTIHVAWERDLPLPEVFDLRKVVENDPSPDGKGRLKMCRGIEVGHIFQLGDKYSRDMEAYVLNQNDEKVPLQMGCYGIGVSRIVAASIEQNHDANGIIWPDAIAPFQIALVPIQLHKSEEVQKASEGLYEQLTAAGFSVLFDDRNERPGVMFNEMDLIGIPHRIVVSQKHLANNNVEYKSRREETPKEVPFDKIIEFLGTALSFSNSLSS